MKDELILFETAKLAKEKRFDLYVGGNYYVQLGSGRIIKKQNNFATNSNVPEKWCNILTQSLLQKWLREVHNSHLIIYLDDDGYTVEWDVLDENGKWNPKKQGAKEDFKTYEEALEAGLQEALKLIT